MILYEAPHHLAGTLGELCDCLGDRRITLCRELTKKFETVIPTTLEEAVERDPDVAHTWNFRLAYAYFYLDQENLALPYFEKALEGRPGDEDTLEMIDRCQRSLAAPLGVKPFRVRTEEGWSSFLAGEGELRALMDQEDREAVGRELVDRCTELLSPAFIDGLTLLGGEPMEPDNQRALLPFLHRVRQEQPGKTIWCYSGFTWEQLTGNQPSHCRCEVTDELLSLLDVLVDGEFVEAQKDITLLFRGSRNQRLIDVPKTRKSGNVTLWSN